MAEDAKVKKWLSLTVRKMWHGETGKSVTVYLSLKSQDKSDAQSSIQSLLVRH